MILGKVRNVVMVLHLVRSCVVLLEWNERRLFSLLGVQNFLHDSIDSYRVRLEHLLHLLQDVSFLLVELL